MIRLLPSVLVLGAFLPATAVAADVDFEGYYRARVRLYDSLSLNHDPSLGEGLAFYAQHRLWLKPTFHIGEDITLVAEVRGLDGVVWGTQPGTVTDPDGTDVALELEDSLDPPTGTLSDALTDFSLWRAWGQVDTNVGRFSFGRMPLRWGAGVWQNDGNGWNADFGDTADRVAWERRFDDVYIQAAFDTNAERLVNDEDDTFSANAAFSYDKERYLAGLLLQYRRTSASDAADGSDGLDLFTADLAGQAELGPVSAQLELVGQFGRGSLGAEINNATISSGGGILDAGLKLGDDLGLGLVAGAATGDGNPTDSAIHTFRFDRDYNVGFILFEQPLPSLSLGAGAGRDEQYAQTGNGLGNAMFLRPRVRYELPKDFSAEGGVLLARAWSAPSSARISYGTEVDLSLRWKHNEHFDFAASFGAFVPGSFFKSYEVPNVTFGSPVFAGQVIGEVRF